MAQAPRSRNPMARLVPLVLLAALIPAAAPAATRAEAAAAARRAAPVLLDARGLPSLDASGRPALSYNPIVSLSDTFLLAGFGFQDLAGVCRTRGWAGEDRTSRVYAHTSSNFVINGTYYGGRAGSSSSENMTGQLASTALRLPRAVALDDVGNLVFSDEGFGQQRLFEANPRTGTVRVYGVYPGPAGTAGPYSAAFDPSHRNIVASDFSRGTLLRFHGDGGAGEILAGLGGSTVDGPAATANIGRPAQIAVAANGDVYFADPTTHRVRKLSGGAIVTVAGTGHAGQGGIGSATASALHGPTGVALDQGGGRLFIADTGTNRVIVVNLRSGAVTSTIPVLAPGSLAFEPTTGEVLHHSSPAYLLPGSLFVTSEAQVFQLDLVSRQLSTVVGEGGYGSPADAALGTQSSRATPMGLTPDGLNGVYFADPGSNLLLHLDGDREVSTTAGLPITMAMATHALWFGADAASAPDEVQNWVQPSGFGNDWSQRLTSPAFSLADHPAAFLSFDAGLDLAPGQDPGAAFGSAFVAVQGLTTDGTWVTLNVHLNGPGAPEGRVGAFTGSGVVQVTASLAADGNELLGLAATTRLRVVVQTGENGSNEDGLTSSTRGALVLDNIGVTDDGVPMI